MSVAQPFTPLTLDPAFLLFHRRIKRLAAALAYKKRKGYTPEFLKKIGAEKHWPILTWDILTFESRLKAADMLIAHSKVNTPEFDELLGRIEQSMNDIDQGENDGGCATRQDPRCHARLASSTRNLEL